VEADLGRPPVSAREEILGRVRAALAGSDTSAVTVPRGYRSATSNADPVDLFCERVADYRAVVTRCSAREVDEQVAAALGSAARVVVPDGFEWYAEGALADDGLTAPDLDEVDAVVTGATLGIASTGTIVLTHGPGQGRRALSLVPDLHVCVVRADQVVPGVPDALALLHPEQPTTWISGPSATSDIELDRVEGVHGPRRLHVLVVDPG
jgi:L-lactate dehydrogenase complex protein LldG